MTDQIPQSPFSRTAHTADQLLAVLTNTPTHPGSDALTLDTHPMLFPVSRITKGEAMCVSVAQAVSGRCCQRTDTTDFISPCFRTVPTTNHLESSPIPVEDITHTFTTLSNSSPTVPSRPTLIQTYTHYQDSLFPAEHVDRKSISTCAPQSCTWISFRAAEETDVRFDPCFPRCCHDSLGTRLHRFLDRQRPDEGRFRTLHPPACSWAPPPSARLTIKTKVCLYSLALLNCAGHADYTTGIVACGGKSAGTGLQTWDLDAGSTVIAHWNQWPADHLGECLKWGVNDQG